MRASDRVKDLFPTDKSHLYVAVPRLETAISQFGEIKTFFGKYKNPIGIEIEIENAYPPEKNLLFWSWTHDGSLKIEGIEFVSIPLSGHCVDYALHEISPTVTNTDNLWSHRTSIHIHQNVSDFNIEKLTTLVGLYAVFEDLFFSFVDQKRKGNNYCYPLTDTSPKLLNWGDENLKYCALNFGNSLKSYNTIEYRHLHGTGSMKTIRRWIQLIVKLHHYVDTHDPKEIRNKIKELSYTSQYRKFLSEIFGVTSSLFDGLSLEEAMNRCVVWAKMYLLLKEY